MGRAVLSSDPSRHWPETPHSLVPRLCPAHRQSDHWPSAQETTGQFSENREDIQYHHWFVCKSKIFDQSPWRCLKSNFLKFVNVLDQYWLWTNAIRFQTVYLSLPSWHLVPPSSINGMLLGSHVLVWPSPLGQTGSRRDPRCYLQPPPPWPARHQVTSVTPMQETSTVSDTSGAYPTQRMREKACLNKQRGQSYTAAKQKILLSKFTCLKRI